MTRILLIALLLLGACGDDSMTTYDPDQAGATLDFTDGVTSVGANWLDAQECRVATVAHACQALPEGATCRVVDQTAHLPGDEVVAEDTGYTLLGNDFDTDGRYLFNRKSATGYVIEVRNMEDLQLTDPSTPRELTLSWSSGGVIFVLTNGRYLAVGSASNGIDIFDLSDDSLVGTFSPTGTLKSGAAIGRGDLLFIVTDNGANGTIYAVDMTTATPDGTFTGTGLSYTQGGTVRVECDDRLVYVLNNAGTDDDLEAFDYEGTQEWAVAGVGDQATIEDIAPDGRGNLWILNNTFLGKVTGWRIAGTATPVIEEHAHMVTNSVRLICDGRYAWILSTDDDSKIYELGERFHMAAVFSTSEYNLTVVSDGMDIVYDYAGGATNGFRRVRGPARERLYGRLGAGWWSHSPLRQTAVPLQ